MARILTANNQTEADQNLATEPLIIVKIEWDSGDVYYADKAITVGAVVAKGAILQMADISSQTTDKGAAEFSSVGVLLDDTDGTLKTVVNTEVLEGKLATVYHYWVGTLEADLLVMLKGRLSGDIRWSEGDRTLSFDIETAIENEVAGFSADETSLPTIHKDAINRPWPMVFGTAIKVPSLRVIAPPTAKTKDFIDRFDTVFRVDDGNDFPQGAPNIQIQVVNVRYTGQFVGDTFTAASINDAHYTSLNLTERVRDDKDYHNPAVFWIADSTVRLVGMYVIINHEKYGWMVNYVDSQFGTKCLCRQSWAVGDSGQPYIEVLMGIEVNGFTPHVITEAAPFVRPSWAATFVTRTYITATEHVYEYEVFQAFETIPNAFEILQGAGVVQITGVPVTYIASLFPATSVKEVYGRRSINGEESLVPIPSSYYTVNLSSSVGGQTCANITFVRPLEITGNEGWDTQIYVTLESTIGDNSADVIKYLVDNFSNLASDAASFASVATDVTNYPVGFAITETEWNTVELCEAIAWQSRCALLIRNNTVFIKYLSAVPTPDFTATEEHIEHRSLLLGFTAIEEAVTKLKATWIKDYTGDVESNKELIYNNNIDEYGLHEQSEDFFIYNREILVKISLYFWGYRYSNLWREASVDSFLKIIALETFDTLQFNVPAVSANLIRSTILDTGHNTDNDSISLEVQMASKAGDDTAGEPIEDLNYWTGDPAEPVVVDPGSVDPSDGTSQIDYNPAGPGGNDIPDTTTTVPGASGKYITIVVEPDNDNPVQRGEDFTVRVELRDFNGNRIYSDGAANIILSSQSDPADLLSGTPVNIVSGVFEGTFQINGGSGSKTGSLHVTLAGYNDRTTDPTFPIIDGLLDLNVVLSADPYERGVNFTIDITNGSPGATLDVTRNFEDGSDELYKVATPITQIVLDGSGEYHATDWNINDGSGLRTINTLIFNDIPTFFLHNPYTTPTFTIEDASPTFETTEDVFFNDNATGNKNPIVAAYFNVSSTGGVNHDRGTNYDLTIQAFDALGNPDTAYVPATTVTLALVNNTDPSDVISPLTTDATGWVNGVKVVTFSITGGAGSDSTDISVTDTSDPTRTGNMSTTINASDYIYSPVGDDYARGYDVQADVGELNGSPAALAIWDDVQNVAHSEMLSSPFTIPDLSILMSIRVNVPTTVSYTGEYALGRLQYDLPNGRRQSANKAFIEIQAGPSRWFAGLGPLLHGNYTLNYKFTEDPNAYVTGADLVAETPDGSVSGNDLFSFCGEVLYPGPVIAGTYFFDIFTEVQAMTQDDQWLWLWWMPDTTLVPWNAAYDNWFTGHLMVAPTFDLPPKVILSV